MRFIKKTTLFLLTFFTVIGFCMPVEAKAELTTQAYGAKYYLNETTSEADICMEVGQKIEVRNLVCKTTGDEDKPLEYCKSKSGFKAKSKNSKIVSVKNGVLTAKKAGDATVVVTKNGQKFKFYIVVTEAKYTLSPEYKKINSYLETLSKKYPDEASFKGKGSTFVKSVTKLTNILNDYANVIVEGEDMIEDECGRIPLNATTPVYMSGVFNWEVKEYLCLENPREYFRLTEMAQDYIQSQSEKAKNLKIKSVSVKKADLKKYYTITIKLKKPISQKQALASHDDYNPYTLSGNLPTEKSWRNDFRVYYYAKLYRIKDNGKKILSQDTTIIGKYKEDTLEATIPINKAATYKLYFSEKEESNLKKYCVTFTIE